MIIPIRCFSCGKPIGQFWEEYTDRMEKGEKAKDILDSFEIKRYCCRAVFLGHVDLIDLAAGFKRG